MNGPQPRVSSPCRGSSILSTSAPMSPSIIVQNGPATTRVRSMTRIPSSGGMRHSSCRVSAINAKAAQTAEPRSGCGHTVTLQRPAGATKPRSHEATKPRRHEDTKPRRHEDTKIRRHEDTKTRRYEDTKAKKKVR